MPNSIIVLPSLLGSALTLAGSGLAMLPQIAKYICSYNTEALRGENISEHVNYYIVGV